jgi:hypothetical protein
MSRVALIIICLIFVFNNTTIAHDGGHGQKRQRVTKVWKISQQNASVNATFLFCRDGEVFLESSGGKVLKFPFESFCKDDQAFIIKKYKEIGQLNQRVTDSENAKSPLTVPAPLIALSLPTSLAFLGLFIYLFFVIEKKNVWSLSSASASLVFFILASCADPKEDVKKSVPANDVAGLKNLFGKFSGVTTSSDAKYFYVSSNGFPEHNMMQGITSWQQQVPIPQEYQGTNSWAIPLQPVLAEHPLSTSSHLMKGAIAVGVNGIPIFNPLNNRGDDAKAFGELDNWGGHCGKADDYHYHLPPVHLQSQAGAGNPIAYALDGFPVYGSTTDQLDENLGKFNADGSYQYHTITTFPYFIAGLRGEVKLDPTTTAPEDQIIPQAFAHPLRGGDYGPLSGAVITAFTKTANDAYSLQYTKNNETYRVDYSWNASDLYTFKYVNPNGTFTTETYQR